MCSLRVEFWNNKAVPAHLGQTTPFNCAAASFTLNQLELFCSRIRSFQNLLLGTKRSRVKFPLRVDSKLETVTFCRGLKSSACLLRGGHLQGLSYWGTFRDVSGRYVLTNNIKAGVQVRQLEILWWGPIPDVTSRKGEQGDSLGETLSP